jgi:putative endonuclease
MKEQKLSCVYIMANERRTVLYVGVSTHLFERVLAHKNKSDKKSFTARYNVDRLVYYSCSESISAAIAEEKRIKAGSRKKKISLIEDMNPEWKDLSEEIGIGEDEIDEHRRSLAEGEGLP